MENGRVVEGTGQAAGKGEAAAVAEIPTPWVRHMIRWACPDDQYDAIMPRLSRLHSSERRQSGHAWACRLYEWHGLRRAVRSMRMLVAIGVWLGITR
jgi:hypothetical protein